MKEIDKIKQKLIKLIRLSEDDTVKDGEISNALAKAQQLMARHNLTRDDIDDAEPDPFAKVQFDRTRAFFYGIKRTAWECFLCDFVCSFVGTVKSYTMTAKDLSGKRRAAVVYYGPSDDAESAADLFSELSTAISMMAITRYGGFSKKSGAVYAEGFVDGLAIKLEAEKKLLRESSDHQTAALMVVSDERALALRERSELWLSKECGVELSRGSGLGGGSGCRDAYMSGQRDGRNYSVTQKAPVRKLA